MKTHVKTIRCVLVLLLTAAAGGVNPPTHGVTVHNTALSANVNGALEELGTRATDYVQLDCNWVRGFDPWVIDRVGRGVPDIDKDVKLKGVKAASDAGYKVIYNLKFLLDGRNGRDDLRDYYPGSAREAALFDAMDDLLMVVGPYVDILVVGNEPIVETLPVRFAQSYMSDWHGESGYPLVIFYDRLTDHVLSHVASDPALDHLEVYCGALNALHKRTTAAMDTWVKAFIRMVDGKRGLVGLDLHTHTDDEIDGRPDPNYGDTVQCLERARQYTDKPLLVTEFSLVHRFGSHLSEPLGATAAGRQFASAYGYPASMAVWEYLDNGFESRRSRGEWIAFCDSRTWWTPNYLKDVQAIFSQYNVRVAAYRTAKADPMDVTAATVPWFLSAMLQPALLQAPEDGSMAENYDFAEDFRNLNKLYRTD